MGFFCVFVVVVVVVFDYFLFILDVWLYKFT